MKCYFRCSSSFPPIETPAIIIPHNLEGESGVSTEEIMGERLKIDRSAQELM